MEAEASCPDCPLAPEETEASWSGAQAIQRTGAGLFFEAVLPSELAGQVIELLPAAVGQGAELHLSLSSSSGLWASYVFSSDPFSGEESAASWGQQLQNTTWSPDADGEGDADPLPPEPLTLRVETTGGGQLSLDAILLLASSPD
jgi:hypothetical protein